MVAEIFVRNNVCIGMHHTPIVQQRVRRLSGSGGHHGSVSDIGLDSHPRPMRNSLDGRSSLDMSSQMKATSGTRLPRSRRNSSTNFEAGRMTMNAAYSSPHHSPEREKRRIPTSDFAGDDATNNISGWNPDTMEKSEVKAGRAACPRRAGAWVVPAATLRDVARDCATAALEEAACADEARASTHPTAQPKDPMYAALESRRAELVRQHAASGGEAGARVESAVEGVCRAAAELGAPLTRDETTLVQILSDSNEDGDVGVERLAALSGLLGEDARQLLREHLQKVTRLTKPLVVGKFEINVMPKTSLPSDILFAPRVWVKRVFGASAAFGVALGSAQQRRDLEWRLRNTQTTGDHPVAELPPLATYLVGDLATRHLQTVEDPFTQQVVDEHNRRVLGSLDDLTAELSRFSERVQGMPMETVQSALDENMNDGSITCDMIKSVHMDHLVLEAVAFGRLLYEVQRSSVMADVLDS